MIALNLIPQEQKIIMKNTRLYAAIKEAVTLILLFASIIAIMLWVSRFYLESDLADLVTANAANVASNEATNQRIIAINKQIDLVSNIENNYASSRKILAAVAHIVPENIALATINYYREESTVEISGLAKSRTDLIDFKNKLDSAGWIKSVDLPITDLIDKENNKFTIKLAIDQSRIF